MSESPPHAASSLAPLLAARSAVQELFVTVPVPALSSSSSPSWALRRAQRRAFRAREDAVSVLSVPSQDRPLYTPHAPHAPNHDPLPEHSQAFALGRFTSPQLAPPWAFSARPRNGTVMRPRTGPMVGRLDTEFHPIWLQLAAEAARAGDLHLDIITDNRAKRAQVCQAIVEISVKKSADIMILSAEGGKRGRKVATRLKGVLARHMSKADEIRRKNEAAEREKERQAKKLNYLLTRTELYAHFMAKRVGTDELAPSPVAGGRNGEEDFEDRRRAEADAAAAVAAHTEKIAAIDETLRSQRGDDISVNRSADEEGLLNAPAIFKGTLKEYQRKGITWLVNLYTEGINGILADEMGLGKTIQTIAFLSYLAEAKGIWGPFLVIAPKSTLVNWAREIAQFCPTFRVLPYWGTVKQRKVLRKFIQPRYLYSRDASFHVLVTSYQMLVTDKAIFKRVAWEYMILDEAQAIKSSSSQRWKVLLSLDQCRNRLLLTGTPIQNNMHELWALLHFIMPTLFDSHSEFADWFSKDIEAHAQDNAALNQHQLQRLYMILKPFMLRRVKKDVLNELPQKTEITLKCSLTGRQTMLYKGIKQRLSIADLLDKARSEKHAKHLMNLVMQFRKVCNHPELLERRQVQSPFVFAQASYEPGTPRDGHHVTVAPPLLKSLKFLLATWQTQLPWICSGDWCPKKLLNIYSTPYISRSPTFQFLSLMGLSPNMASLHFLAECSFSRWSADDSATSFLQVGAVAPHFNFALEFPRDVERLSRPAAVAPDPAVYCSDSRFSHLQNLYRHNLWLSALLFRPMPVLNKPAVALAELAVSGVGSPDRAGVYASQALQALTTLFDYGRPFAGGDQGVQVPKLRDLVWECGKMRLFGQLLRILKLENHRVLVYSQMTSMLDILQDFLTSTNYSFVRLDGSSSLDQRRSVVDRFQNDPRVFVFLLSTRAGGLGINLVAADTVIFYDNDWNPTMDSQAMDRAHRLGQTRPVTVYRLITRHTVEERILERAKQKARIQSLVIGGGRAEMSDEGLWHANEMAELLIDDDDHPSGQNLRKRPGNSFLASPNKKQRTLSSQESVSASLRHLQDLDIDVEVDDNETI